MGPLRGETALAGEAIAWRLERSHDTTSDQEVRLRAAAGTAGTLLWRRYPTADAWTEQPMQSQGGELVAALPKQPAAGKLEYRLRLERAGASVTIPPPPASAVTRFKGPVPAAVLVPHILSMFVGMLLSNAAAFAALAGLPSARRYGLLALLLLTIGGAWLGPWVQKYAFDAWWTGFPYGTDLTDNKTAIAILAWIGAAIAGRGGRSARGAIVAAALVTLAVFAVPHSMFGSQIDWKAAPPPGR